MSKLTLTQLAEKYGCDKLYAHSYMPVYEELLGKRDVKRLLEIGIGYEGLMKDFVPFYVHGASLRMWSDYWPDATIMACDIREDALYNDGNIHSWQCDQSKLPSLLELCYMTCNHHTGMLFEVVIDDGSHVPEHQIFTAGVLFHQWVSPGGIYIIEDCREPDRVADALGGEIMRFNKRADDCLVVIRR